eukprot:11346604-Alexandrium_andersonii.AAC.1
MIGGGVVPVVAHWLAVHPDWKGLLDEVVADLRAYEDVGSPGCALFVFGPQDLASGIVYPLPRAALPV